MPKPRFEPVAKVVIAHYSGQLSNRDDFERTKYFFTNKTCFQNVDLIIYLFISCHSKTGVTLAYKYVLFTFITTLIIITFDPVMSRYL